MIALVRAKGVDAHARDYEGFLKGRAAKEFDAVVLFDVLEHAPEPRALLALIKPVLKRGGHLCVTFPNERRPMWFGREDYDYPPHHFTRWNPEALRGFLQGQGFSIVALETVGPSVRWFSETMFYAVIAPAAIGAARRLLFGAGSRGTLSDLYSSVPAGTPGGAARGLLADGERRRRLSNAFKILCRAATYPVGVLLKLACLLRKDSGEYLYALARYDN